MIVITEFMDETGVARLKEHHDVTHDPGLADRQGDLPAMFTAGRALIVRNRTRVTDALLDAAPQLGATALDVFETEPLTAEAAKKFAGVPGLVLTPHIAGVTEQSNVRVCAMIADAVLNHLPGKGVSA